MLLFIIISSLSMVFIKITTKPIEFEHFILLVLLSWPSNRKTRNRARATKRARQSSKRKVRDGRGTGRGMGLLGWAESRESGNPLGIDPEIHVRLGILTCQRMSSVWGYSKNCGKHGDIMFKHYNK